MIMEPEFLVETKDLVITFGSPPGPANSAGVWFVTSVSLSQLIYPEPLKKTLTAAFPGGPHV